jgi:spore germination cell wall hydrolase CwlJ-like protein
MRLFRSAAMALTMLVAAGCATVTDKTQHQSPVLSTEKVEALEPIQNRFVVRREFDQQEIDCLAKNIYFEARGEPDRGKAAVAHVTLNRMESGRYPDTVCGVVYDRNRRGCQFSWTCDRHVDRLRDLKSFYIAKLIASDIYINRPRDFTQGSMFYHANYVRPYWASSFTKTLVIGSHIFYRERT